jgi:murein DD-endopeptidase MepM/ murein hydrolase activator NlpD
VNASRRVQVARAFLGFDIPGATERLSVYFDVQLRHAFAAGEKWFASLADKVAPSLAVPDLSVLRAEPVKGIESSGYGWREDPIDGGGRFHKGTDYKADRGTPVYAAGDGVVLFCGRQNGYGKVIYLDHGGGLITRYAHLRDIGVHKGDVVIADTQIGEVGSTGRTTGPHLHFEVRLDGRAVDPTLAMDVAEMQRSQPAGVVRLAAMALLPDAQKKKIDRHGPPKQRPERAGRSKRVRPSS